jgi:hypothetical protein
MPTANGLVIVAYFLRRAVVAEQVFEEAGDAT